MQPTPPIPYHLRILLGALAYWHCEPISVHGSLMYFYGQRKLSGRDTGAEAEGTTNTRAQAEDTDSMHGKVHGAGTQL